MRNLRRIGNQMSISIPTDEQGYLGRQCPQGACSGYFKITPGTGIQGPAPCHCPYCGYAGASTEFFTPEQVEYAKSVALRRITGAILEDLKTLEFNHPPRGPFGIGLSLEVEGQPRPIRYYRENQLETEVICGDCTLRYAIYGVFAFCPDCGTHNSLQILAKNLELVEKELALAVTVERDLATHLIGDALENAVAAFDGFGREACRVHAAVSSDPKKAEAISFQNLNGARQRVQDCFGFDLAGGVGSSDWDLAFRCFQKRHLLAHAMGVVDEAYLKATGDVQAVKGRKVSIAPDEVASLVATLKLLGAHLVDHLPPRPGVQPQTDGAP